MSAISIRNLTKTFDNHPAVSGLHLEIPSGEAFGIYGGPESGKSTLLRILMHFLYPSEGEAEILGHNVVTDAKTVHRYVGYVPADPVFYDTLSVAETIRYGAGAGTDPSFRKALLESFAIDPKAMGWELSRRERTKLSIIIALLRNPPVYLLDEPFTHLAPVERSHLLKHLAAVKEAGATILMTAADPSELYSLCDRIAWMQDGVVQEAEAIETHLANQGVFVVVHGDIPAREVTALAYRVVVSTAREKQFFYRGDLRRLLSVLASHELQHVEILDAAAGDLYVHHYGGQL